MYIHYTLSLAHTSSHLHVHTGHMLCLYLFVAFTGMYVYMNCLYIRVCVRYVHLCVLCVRVSD